ncbi:Ig-like domain repeat protein [Corallococcus sp. Z5C101001]|uniref:Ig-like domain repeat protein n=1 Tax=Corallococcus sp. Z5C101001 TaxID=2596829 RepID=UPI00117D9F4B|nr:Ig-like domain repeat protein [Corallococcus sp. Z5C101001]TSC31309.1 hypothetical protein FOF48_11545 [Corallococcus sp. Z5C101001]
MSAALRRAFLALLLCASLPAFAQATRTWVSGVGDDANPCSRTAPCKTFAGAFAKTATGGEIDALDMGGFGALTITRAITIDGGPNAGGVAAAGTPGFTINAGPQDVVILRRLNIISVTPTPNSVGIQFNTGRALHVERSQVHGFQSDGIRFSPAAEGQLFLDGVKAFANGGAGVRVGSTGSLATAFVTHSTVSGNQRGLELGAGALATVHDLTASGNTEAGIWMRTESGEHAELNVEQARLANNGVGLQAASVGSGSRALIRLSKAAVSSNVLATTRLVGTGTILSFGNNRMAGGSTLACPAGTLSLEPFALTTTERGSTFAPVEFSVLGALGSASFAVSGALPRGLSMEGGILAGIPEEGGDYPLTLSVTDGNGCTVSRSTSLTVTCQPAVLEPVSIPSGTTGQPYTAPAFTHTGGVGVSTFNLDGALPIGLEFKDGALVGMPTEYGSFPLTVTATDPGRCSVSGAFTLEVARAADFQETQTQLTASANPAHAGEPITLTVRVTGGQGEPSGTATLLDGDTVLATVAIQGREARHTLTSLESGHYVLSAIYSGDTRFGGSRATPLALEVLPKTPPVVTPEDPAVVTPEDKGCGCSESGASGGSALLLLAWAIGRRRRPSAA